MEQLPLLISATVLVLVVLTVLAFAVLPTLAVLVSEPQQILRSLKSARVERSESPGWRDRLRLLAWYLTGVNTIIGRLTAWLVLYMVLMQFVVVIMRYVFSYGSIQMQESIWYMHGLLFMLGAGYTLAKEGHVRLDIFYRASSKKIKAWVNLVGALVCLIPFCIVNFELAWPMVLNSWAVLEGSTEASGLPFIYLFKTVVLIFSVLVATEGVALGIRSVLVLTDEGLNSDSTSAKK